MRIPFSSFILALCLLCCTPGTGAAFMDIFKRKPLSFECAFEKDHNPPLDLNSEAHKLYMQARDFENSREVLTRADQENLTRIYEEAAAMGHWKARAHLVRRYMEGIGARRNPMRAYPHLRDLAEMDVPVGVFNWGLFVMNGWGAERADREEGMKLIHKAAALGSPDAQYMLGEHYIYIKHDDALGLRYHVCAMRQGHGKSASAIASFLEIVDKNYPLYAEYLLRGGGLGDMADLLAFKGVFSSDHPDVNRGFSKNAALADCAIKHFDLLEKNPRLRFPSISKECGPIPLHPTLGDGRHLPSKLKEACGGKWPDEAYPELKDW